MTSLHFTKAVLIATFAMIAPFAASANATTAPATELSIINADQADQGKAASSDLNAPLVVAQVKVITGSSTANTTSNGTTVRRGSVSVNGNTVARGGSACGPAGCGAAVTTDKGAAGCGTVAGKSGCAAVGTGPGGRKGVVVVKPR